MSSRLMSLNNNNKDKKKICLILLIIALIVFPFIVDSTYILSLVIEMCIFAIFALSYDLLLGFTGIVSFGHALFFGIGAYGTGMLMKTYGWPFVLTLFPVMLLCIAFGVGMGAVTIRAKDTYFSMLTLAIGQFIWVLVVKLRDVTGGEDGFHGVKLLFDNNRLAIYYFIIAVLLLVYIFAKKFINSPTGRVLQAIRENEDRSGMIGYSVLNYKVLVILISGTIAGLAGSLYAVTAGSLTPALIHSNTTMHAIMMTVIGGMGTLTGPILGAFVVKTAEHVLSGITQRWMLAFGILYVIIVLYFPGGITKIKMKNNVFFNKIFKNKKDVEHMEKSAKDI